MPEQGCNGGVKRVVKQDASAAGAAPERYKGAARQVADWLRFVAVEERGGVTWSAVPGHSTAGEPSLGWGALGPMVFFADGYRTLGDGAWLELADRGATWLRGKMASAGPDMPPGLFAGLAGFAVVFNELARLGASMTEDQAKVFELLAGAAAKAGSG